MFCDTYYGYASFLMIMNVIVLYEMRVINANLEHGLQYYLHSDSMVSRYMVKSYGFKCTYQDFHS